MEIIGDYRCRRMHEHGASFREIARSNAISLTRVRASLREAPASAMRRALRDEIRKAGGPQRWWRS
jgi:hypothetical protein